MLRFISLILVIILSLQVYKIPDVIINNGFPKKEIVGEVVYYNWTKKSFKSPKKYKIVVIDNEGNVYKSNKEEIYNDTYKLINKEVICVIQAKEIQEVIE